MTNPFDNRCEPTPAQAAFLSAMPDVLALEQTRSGSIIVCDMRNPYRPLYVLTVSGSVCEVYNHYHLTTQGG